MGLVVLFMGVVLYNEAKKVHLVGGGGEQEVPLVGMEYGDKNCA